MKINRQETVLIIRALELYRDTICLDVQIGKDVKANTEKLLAKIRVELESKKK